MAKRRVTRHKRRASKKSMKKSHRRKSKKSQRSKSKKSHRRRFGAFGSGSPHSLLDFQGPYM